jgi:hypothetical protein
MAPWLALRPERLATWDMPFSLNQTTAFPKSPWVSAKAFLQSIIPAPVFSRSSFTAFAVISIVRFLTVSDYFEPRFPGLKPGRERTRLA